MAIDMSGKGPIGVPDEAHKTSLCSGRPQQTSASTRFGTRCEFISRAGRAAATNAQGA